MNSIQRAACFTALAAAALTTTAGCEGRNKGVPENVSPGIVIEQPGLVTLEGQIPKAVTAAPPRVMKGGGLVGALGGARVKLLAAGPHEVLLPMPQLTETQIPVCYAILTTPREAGKEYRLSMREASNAVVRVQLQGSRNQEVQIDWSSIILVADRPVSPDRDPAEPYLRQTTCVQSEDKQVRTLADKLWPGSGKLEDYAANIQEFIGSMKQKEPPRSMDALGILKSGGNWICTANANLAAALLRSRRVPSQPSRRPPNAWKCTGSWNTSMAASGTRLTRPPSRKTSP